MERHHIWNTYLANEDILKQSLLKKATLFSKSTITTAQQHTQMWVDLCRKKAKKNLSLTDHVMLRYPLSSDEGLLLMLLCEAFLRIPDEFTRKIFIEGMLIQGRWEHLNTHTQNITQKIAEAGLKISRYLAQQDTTLSKTLNKITKTTLTHGIKHAIQLFSKKFVIAESADQALRQAQKTIKQGYLYSFDQLGERALTAQDVSKYYEDYAHLIETIAKDPHKQNYSVSIKLSALHPRYCYLQRERVHAELIPRALSLARLAISHDIGFTIDAEESERLDLSLDVIEALAHACKGSNKLGVAVQAYEKRAYSVIAYLGKLAKDTQQKIAVRLVKGAYWDTEIKLAQVKGLANYPVFTSKAATDISYLVCAKAILSNTYLFGQFATHNPFSIAFIQQLGEKASYEFQMLYGMGEHIFSPLYEAGFLQQPCRIYAPIGVYHQLLPYLARRLCENGANTSFWHRFFDAKIPIETLSRNPMQQKEQSTLPLPPALYGAQRQNARTLNLSDPRDLTKINGALAAIPRYATCPLSSVFSSNHTGEHQDCYAPFKTSLHIGTRQTTYAESIPDIIEAAHQAFSQWSTTPVVERSRCLKKAADMMEEDMVKLITILIYEAGKTWEDALAEVREAIDFLRYYAYEAEKLLTNPEKMEGPTGEDNHLFYRGRGVIVCISPWNFPLAIFLGQVCAALVTGNTVIAKPAYHTPHIGFVAVHYLYKAGIPLNVLHFLPGSGKIIGDCLIRHSLCAGVVFTGSTDISRRIHQILAQKEGPIVPLIAETGGQNCMIVDSSALLEQVVQDVIVSAFQSAGQRCSALRVCFVQKDILLPFYELLVGALKEQTIGLPTKCATDIGPVIHKKAQKELNKHIDAMKNHPDVMLIYESKPSGEIMQGSYVMPHVFEIPHIRLLEQENFGPILHVIPFEKEDIDAIITQINSTGYGLTFGLHTRVQSRIDTFPQRIVAGNCYINRNMVGAVVSAQPFGGQGLSGTGFKAGGPNYLRRFLTEQALSVNTTAQGANVTLMTT